MNREAIAILSAYTLTQAGNEPLKRRVMLFRAVAAVLPEREQGVDLSALADELEACDKKQEQLLLKLRQEEVA